MQCKKFERSENVHETGGKNLLTVASPKNVHELDG